MLRLKIILGSLTLEGEWGLHSQHLIKFDAGQQCPELSGVLEKHISCPWNAAALTLVYRCCHCNLGVQIVVPAISN